MASAEAPRDVSEADGSTEMLPLSARAGQTVVASFGLSPVQEAMYFHAVASEANDLYIVQQRIEIEGLLDPAIFQAAWETVVERHQALRTVFRWEPGRAPRQFVLERLAVDFESVDLTDDPAGADVIAARFESDRSIRFDLANGPLMRVVLFTVAPHRHTLLWSQHHLVQDGWSASIVLQELFAAHEDLAADR